MTITNHIFSDHMAEVKSTNADDEYITIKIPTKTPWIFFDRDDVKAMALHFKLIARVSEE